MGKSTAGSASIPDREEVLELSDNGRETSTPSSGGTTTPDPNNTTPGSVSKGGDGDDDH